MKCSPLYKNSPDWACKKYTLNSFIFTILTMFNLICKVIFSRICDYG